MSDPIFAAWHCIICDSTPCVCRDHGVRQPWISPALLDLGEPWSETLATNIAWAAFGCEAFELGHSQANHEITFSRHGYRCDEDWRPGCGRPAPGMEER